MASSLYLKKQTVRIQFRDGGHFEQDLLPGGCVKAEGGLLYVYESASEWEAYPLDTVESVSCGPAEED